MPENPSSLIVNDANSRFSSAMWFDKMRHLPVTIIGLGGIGSHAAFIISRLNPLNMTLVDFDTVELANLSGQFYERHDLSRAKATVIAHHIEDYSDYWKINVIKERFTMDTSLEAGIVICGLDNMEARRNVFTKWYNYVRKDSTDKKECLFIDGRLAAEEFQIFAIRGDDYDNILRYHRDFLFDDYSAEPTLCSYKQTTYAATMIASYIANIYVNFVSNLVNNDDSQMERPVPFLTYYDASLMFFKTEV